MYDLKSERQRIANYLGELGDVFSKQQEINGKYLQTVEPLSFCLSYLGERAGYFAAMTIIKHFVDTQKEPEEITLGDAEDTLVNALLNETLDFADHVISDVDDDINDLEKSEDAEGFIRGGFYSSIARIFGVDLDDLEDGDQE